MKRAWRVTRGDEGQTFVWESKGKHAEACLWKTGDEWFVCVSATAPSEAEAKALAERLMNEVNRDRTRNAGGADGRSVSPTKTDPRGVRAGGRDSKPPRQVRPRVGRVSSRRTSTR